MHFGGIMRRSRISSRGRIAGLALLVMFFLPMATYAQRRWVVTQPRRNRVVIYQPRPYVIYQRSAARYRYTQPYYNYGYSQPYYSNSYSYNPYYTNRNYSYGYSRPYYGSQYTYVEPGYRYNNYAYRQRYRRDGITLGIRLR